MKNAKDANETKNARKTEAGNGALLLLPADWLWNIRAEGHDGLRITKDFATIVLRMDGNYEDLLWSSGDRREMQRENSQGRDNGGWAKSLKWLLAPCLQNTNKDDGNGKCDDWRVRFEQENLQKGMGWWFIWITIKIHSGGCQCGCFGNRVEGSLIKDVNQDSAT